MIVSSHCCFFNWVGEEFTTILCGKGHCVGPLRFLCKDIVVSFTVLYSTSIKQRTLLMCHIILVKMIKMFVWVSSVEESRHFYVTLCCQGCVLVLPHMWSYKTYVWNWNSRNIYTYILKSICEILVVAFEMKNSFLSYSEHFLGLPSLPCIHPVSI